MKEGISTMISASQISNKHSIKAITELFHEGSVEIDNFDVFIDYINNVITPTSNDVPFIAFNFNFKTNNIVFLNDFQSVEKIGHSYVYTFHKLKTVTKYIFEYLQFQTKRSQEKLYQQILKAFQSKALNLYKKSVNPDSNFKNFKNHDILFFDLNEAGLKDYQLSIARNTYSDDNELKQMSDIASYIEDSDQLEKLFSNIFATQYDTFYIVMKILTFISKGLKDKSHMLDVIYFLKDCNNNNEFFKSLYLFFRTVDFEYNVDLNHIKDIKDMMSKDESSASDFIANLGQKPFANNHSFVNLLSLLNIKLPNQKSKKINILSQYSLSYYADIDFNKNINNIYSEDQNFEKLYIDDSFFKNSFIYHTEDKNVYHNFLKFITSKFDKLIISQKSEYMMNLKYLSFFGKNFDFSKACIIPNASMNNSSLISDLNRIIGYSGQGLFIFDEDAVKFQKEYTLYPVKIGL